MLPKTNRIESIDLLRDVVMVIMALDHVRDYFQYGFFFSDPSNLDTKTPALFFTRFITHYCAPVFIFLAGTSAFLYGSKKPKRELFRFLFTRGLWLFFLEIVVNNFLWKFDIFYSLISLQVIWAIGLSMIFLSLLIYLPKKIILLIGLFLIVGHNLLDGITLQGTNFKPLVWYIMHQPKSLSLSEFHSVRIMYPVLPWIGVMALGYLFGTFYQKGYNPMVRAKWLLQLGFGALIVFFVLRGINIYGDLEQWKVQDTPVKTILSFFKITKHPPSLMYLCITLGPALLFLFIFENTKNKITDFFLVYGRVPLFYYFLHIFVIHILAALGLLLSGGDWNDMIFNKENFNPSTYSTYGYSLLVVYIVWIAVVLILYPFCKKYMIYKANNKDKWWLSYL